MVGPALMDTPATQTRSYRNLHVQGFDTSVTDAMLRSWFAPCGTVRSAKVMMNARTGVSRCIGFVLFESEDEGLLAFHRMNGSTQMSANNAKCVLVIQPSDHDGEQAAYETSTVFLRNIPSTITEADLHKLTSRFGDVVKLAISNIASRKRKPKPSEQSQQPTAGSEDDDAAGTQNGNAAAALLDLKMASVEFVTVDSARQCIEALHNTNPFGLCVTLMAKFGDTEKIREIRKANRKVRAAGASAPSSIPSPSCPETTPTKDANPTSHKVDFLSAPVSVSSASSSATPTPPPGFVTTGLATAGSTPSPLLPLHQQPSPASSLMTSTSSIPSQLPQGPTFMMPPQFAPAPHVPQSNPFAPALFTFASASQLQPQPHFYDLHPPATAMYPPHAMYIAVPVTENPAGVAAPTFLFPTAGPGYHHHQPTYVVMHHPMPAPQH